MQNHLYSVYLYGRRHITLRVEPSRGEDAAGRWRDPMSKDKDKKKSNEKKKPQLTAKEKRQRKREKKRSHG